MENPNQNNPLSFRNIFAGILIAVISGIILYMIIPREPTDKEFDEQITSSTPTASSINLSGYWDFTRQRSQTITSSGQIYDNFENDDIVISLDQNGPLITGEILGGGGKYCKDVRINGEVQQEKISWTMEFFGTCCPGAKNEFTGTLVTEGESVIIIGEQEPSGRPPSRCQQSWAKLTGMKQE